MRAKVSAALISLFCVAMSVVIGCRTNVSGQDSDTASDVNESGSVPLEVFNVAVDSLNTSLAESQGVKDLLNSEDPAIAASARDALDRIDGASKSPNAGQMMSIITSLLGENSLADSTLLKFLQSSAELLEMTSIQGQSMGFTLIIDQATTKRQRPKLGVRC
jgi:hypothetical protein